MDTPVLLAIIGSGLNTVNDLIYRNIARRSSANTFTFYVLAAFSSALTALAINLSVYGCISFSRVNISYGILLGFLSFTVYILFLLSLNSSSTVVSVTIYRLNMIPSTLFAVLLLHEHISIKRAGGLLLCICAIVTFAVGEKREKEHSKKPIYMAMGACVLGGALNFFNKLAVTNGGNPLTLIFWRFFTVSLLACFLILKGKCNAASIKDVSYSFFSGVTLILALFFFLNAMKRADLSLISPISQLSFLSTSLISTMIFGEKMDKFKIVGIVSAVAAMIFII